MEVEWLEVFEAFETDTTPSSSHAPAKNVPWTYPENCILLGRVHDNLDSRGRPKWAAVSKGLPGRTAQESRCRYRRICDAETRRKRGESFRNKCHTCGQLRRGHVCPGVTVASRDAKLAAARAGCPEVRGHETRRPAPEQATEAVAAPLRPEIKVVEKGPGGVEELSCAPCEEPDASKQEVKVSAGDTEDSNAVGKAEAFTLLSLSGQPYIDIDVTSLFNMQWFLP
tara:strand:+ start:2817 stop:3494 length:678 start_codon:yes stop_codon:yes gene_type:complete